jgi:ATP-dependent RNA helicase DDX18/HAS1
LNFDLQDYIHRVGRTARGEKGKGSALLFLLPQELKFLIYLKVMKSMQNNLLLSLSLPLSEVTKIMCLQAAKISLTEYEFNNKNVPNLQSHLVSTSFAIIELYQSVIQIHSELITQVGEQENIVGENYFLNQSAKEAYRSYILAYNSHAMKDIFNVHDLDMKV